MIELVIRFLGHHLMTLFHVISMIRNFSKIKCPSKYEDGFLNWENDKDFPLAKDHSLKTSHQYYFQVQLQMFICKFSSVDFLLYSPKNNGTAMLTAGKSNKHFIEKINAKLWQYL